MKLVLLIHLFALFAISACQLFSSPGNLLAFIPGTYVSEWSSQYSHTRDTILIQPGTSDRDYQITRRIFHEYKLARQRSPEYAIDHWAGTFVPRQQLILIHQNGRTLSFDPKAGELHMGVMIYKKL